MNPDLEDRIRRHYAERTLNEPVPQTEEWTPPARRGARAVWRPVLALATAAAVVAGVALVVTAVRDENTPVVTDELPTTVPTTEPTTSTTAPTTVTSVQPDPNATFPVVAASTNGVLAWYDGANWTSARTETPAPIVGGELWRIVGTDAPIVEVPGGELFLDCGHATEGSQAVDIPGFTDGVAVTGTHDPQPRPVQVRANVEDYRDEALRAMRDGPVALQGEPEILQVVEADLDGDGTLEVIIEIEHFDDPTKQVVADGDFKALFVLGPGHAGVSLLGQWIANVDGVTEPVPESWRLGAVADLNGSGNMQVVVEHSAPTADRTYVYGVWPTATISLFYSECAR